MKEREGARDAGGRRRLSRVVLPGADGLVLERRSEGRFSWSASGAAAVPEEVVSERARTRMHECEEAIELCDYWLGPGLEDKTAAERDQILDSRFRWSQERKLLEDFLNRTGSDGT